MANIVNWTGCPRATAPRAAAHRVSLGLDDTDRIGVVGLNGAGKSTLLRLLTRSEEPDDGRVSPHRREPAGRLGCPQTLHLSPEATVRDVVLGTEWLAESWAPSRVGRRRGVRGILDGLGMLPRSRPADRADVGGERRRVALAPRVVRESD